jgi:hypothetical protein
VRPFTLASLKRLLSKGGASIADDGKEFWMDPIRTRCLVSYEDKAVAESVVATMSGKTWPTVGGKVLDAEMAVGSGFADVRRREDGAKIEVRCDGGIADTRRVMPQLCLAIGEDGFIAQCVYVCVCVCVCLPTLVISWLLCHS